MYLTNLQKVTLHEAISELNTKLGSMVYYATEESGVLTIGTRNGSRTLTLRPQLSKNHTRFSSAEVSRTCAKIFDNELPLDVLMLTWLDKDDSLKMCTLVEGDLLYRRKNATLMSHMSVEYSNVSTTSIEMYKKIVSEVLPGKATVEIEEIHVTETYKQDTVLPKDVEVAQLVLDNFQGALRAVALDHPEGIVLLIETELKCYRVNIITNKAPTLDDHIRDYGYTERGNRKPMSYASRSVPTHSTVLEKCKIAHETTSCGSYGTIDDEDFVLLPEYHLSFNSVATSLPYQFREVILDVSTIMLQLTQCLGDVEILNVRYANKSYCVCLEIEGVSYTLYVSRVFRMNMNTCTGLVAINGRPHTDDRDLHYLAR